MCIPRTIDALSEISDEAVTVLFGGSVTKHTYVDGLSDIDALVVISGDDVPDDSPEDIRREMAERLRARLPAGAEVAEGVMAVNVTYADGLDLQLLPAVRRGDTFLIASESGDRWSAINPRAFAGMLSAENARLSGHLVPTIKLAKTVAANLLPEDQRPSGYHLESLAIQAFRGYDGPLTPRALLTRFFSKAPSHVLEPIRDSTGQSIPVDGYLGESGSLQRRVLAHGLERIARRCEFATSLDDWKGIIGVD